MKTLTLDTRHAELLANSVMLHIRELARIREELKGLGYANAGAIDWEISNLQALLKQVTECE